MANAFRDGWSQHKQRRSIDPNNSGEFFTDQHGRQYHAEVEIKSGDPCGPLRLAEPRRAPLTVDLILYGPSQNAQLMRGQANRHRASARYDIEILWDVLITRQQEAQRGREQFKSILKQTRPHLTERELELQAGPTRGNRATWPVRVYTEAKRGNAYLLGLRPFDPSNPSDVWLKSYLDPDPQHLGAGLADDFPETTEAGALLDAEDTGETREYAVARLRGLGKSWKETADTLGCTVNQARAALIKAQKAVAA